MPAIIRPQPSKVGRSIEQVFSNPKDLLRRLSYEHSYHTVLHSSFEPSVNILPYENGFVHTVLNAFQRDLHLELRPDDVWLAILSQLSFFINAQAEELRSFFVRHEGQTAVEVDMRPLELSQVDVSVFVERMAKLVQTQLKNNTEWLLPRFSTTTPTDETVAHMMLLGSLKKYFNYHMRTGCGFPSVTLQGTRDDWQLLRQSIQHLSVLGNFQELEYWIKCLDCIIMHMIAGFDTPDADEVKDFWMRAVHSHGERVSGGLVTLSGWLTAFCFWQADGKTTRTYTEEELRQQSMVNENPDEWARLEIAGIGFPVIARNDIPGATVHVPVCVSDGFTKEQALVIAGLIGADVRTADGSTVSPRLGWWLLQKK